MLSLRASSSSNNARSRRRRCNVGVLSPAAAATLMLLHRVSGSSNADTTTNDDAYRLFESQVVVINNERSIDWEALAAEIIATNGNDSTSSEAAVTPKNNDDTLPVVVATSPTTVVPPSVSNIASPTTVPPSSAAPTTTEPTAKPTQPLLNTVGNDGSPPQFYPLGLCQGDCDNDDECAGNLICYQRGRNETVPGCVGGQNEGEPTDFCILPNTTAAAAVASPTVSPSAAPTAQPTAQQTQQTQPLNTVGDDGSPPQFYPLGLCQGDCDNDDECAGNLICYQRGRNETVPGCAGGQNEGEPTDFCILPNTTAAVVVASPTVSPSAIPTPLPTTAEPTSLATTANPTSLPTSQPTTVTPTTSIPTTTRPTPQPTTNSTIQIPTPPAFPPAATTATVQPTAKPTQPRINRVGNDGRPPEFYPLGLCQGDCDNDDECAGNLICHQRERNGAVPGCAGGLNEGEPTDFCILPPFYTASPTTSDAPSHQPTISAAPSVSHAPSHQPSFSPTNAPTMNASAPVRLRLYWTRSSNWQESSRETFWCLQCRSGACKTNSIIEVDHCSSSSTRQKFQYYARDNTFRPMTDPSLCFEENGWDRETNPIKLKRCNGSSRQRWKGFKEERGDPFEFKSGRNSGYCMTQAHHPKAHERVFPQQCRRARNHKTSKWVVY